MPQRNFKEDFELADCSYLLNHSVGRPLKSTKQAFADSFFSPWSNSGREPWGDWLGIIENFTSALAKLFNAKKEEFCPQANLSSGLTKLLLSLPRLQQKKCVILMSEMDFPSMGFAMCKTLPHCELRFIPQNLDVTDANIWDDQLKNDVDLVFISHAYSNSGQQAPLDQIIASARSRNILSIVDVAQSAGIIPLDLSKTRPDFMLGSSVKWLCGGPGAAYLWVKPEQLQECQPIDVGWFSHENPFEFDIHDFRYHPTAMRFWGGTPSIAPYAIAAHTIKYFAEIGSEKLRAHNQQLIELMATELGEHFVSPLDPAKRSATMILNFGSRQEKILADLQDAKISLDSRYLGMRVSPHIYNNTDDIQCFTQIIRKRN